MARIFILVGVAGFFGLGCTAPNVDMTESSDFAVLVLPVDAFSPVDLTASCTDHLWNGTESDVDCGGTCGPCGNGHMCKFAGDCGSGVCQRGICVDASCTDQIKNGSETDLDCGGSCPKCDDKKGCRGGADCKSGVCTANLCAPPACSDKVQNGSETDVDCGGDCPPCAPGRPGSVGRSSVLGV